jgi:hypothetical protein
MCRSYVCAVLTRYGGASAAARPLAWITWTWLEPYSRGAYVGTAPPGLLSRVGGSWRAPCGALHWAAAEVAGAFAGCVLGPECASVTDRLT